MPRNKALVREGFYFLALTKKLRFVKIVILKYYLFENRI